MKASEFRKLIREEVSNILNTSDYSTASNKMINEATTEYFTKPLPHAKYKYHYNDDVVNGKYKIAVFGYNHKAIADDLHKALVSSKFLEKYPLFSIRIDPMDGYKPV